MANSRVTGTIYLTIASLIYMLSGYFLSVWLGRHLGPEVYGKYGVIISLMTLINLIQTSGLPQATARFIAEESDKAMAIFKRAMHVQLILASILMAVLGIISIPSARFLGDTSLVPFIAATALILPLYGLYSIYLGYYNGMHLFGKQAIINIAYSLAKMIFVILLTLWFGLAGAVMGFVVAPLFAILTGGFWPKGKSTSFPAKQLVSFSLPLILFSFLSMSQLSIDLFLVKKLMPDGEWAGYYVAAQNISLVPYLGLSAFSQMILPGVARALGANDKKRAATLLSDAYRYLLLGLLPVVALFMATSEQLISLLYSSTYKPGAEALTILVAAYAALTIYVLSANSINGAGKPKYSNIISALGVCISIVLAWMLIPIYGIQGAALGVLVGALVSMMLGLIFTRILIKHPTAWLSFIRICLLSLGVYFIARYFGGDTIIHLLFATATSFVFYFFGLFALRELNSDELLHIKKLVIIPRGNNNA